MHVFNRGNRKLPIVNDDHDRWRFLYSLRFFNDRRSSVNAIRSASFPLKSDSDAEKSFRWPENWPPQEPLVKILAYCLANNHFHLLLKETDSGGITAFMRKLGTGFTNYFNVKYKETGRVFQGAFKARTVCEEEYLQYLDAYIQVMNPMKLRPAESGEDIINFEKGFEYAKSYPFCSLGEAYGSRNYGIIDRDVLLGKFNDIKTYETFAKDAFYEKGIGKFLDDLVKD